MGIAGLICGEQDPPMFRMCQGRRRIVGLGFLGLALMLMAGWMRSFVYYDEVWVNLGAAKVVNSLSGSILLFWSNPGFGQHEKIDSRWQVYRSTSYDNGWKTKIAWQWEWLGFARGQRLDYQIGIIPYWSLTLPCSVVAAWLLLIQPGAIRKTVIAEDGDLSEDLTMTQR